MNKTFNLKELSIPEIKNRFCESYRSISTEENEDGENVWIRCILVGEKAGLLEEIKDYESFPKIEIKIEEESKIDRNCWALDGGAHYRDYLCVECNKIKDDNGKSLYLTRFYKPAPQKWIPVSKDEESFFKEEKIKPYSEMIVKALTPYKVGARYLLGVKPEK